MSTPAQHRVRSGESLSLVAKRHGLSVAALAKANGLKATQHLVIGQVLRLPGDRLALSPKACDHVKGKAAAAPVAKSLKAPKASVDAEAPTLESMSAMIRKLERLGVERSWLAETAAEHGVPVEMALAIIWKESKGNPKAKSSAGAKGLMQLMPNTARSVGIKDAYNPVQNLRGGLRYMGENLARFKNNLPLSLAAYNAGPTKVAKLGRVPQNAETREYVERIPEWMPIAKAAWQATAR